MLRSQNPSLVQFAAAAKLRPFGKPFESRKTGLFSSLRYQKRRKRGVKDERTPNISPKDRGCPDRLGFESVTSRRGFLEQKHRNQKMTPDQLMGFAALVAVALYLYYLTITPRL